MMEQASPAIRFDEEGDDYVVRVRRDLVDRETITRFFDYLMMEAGSRKFDMTDDEVAAFADEVDRAAWERLRPMVDAKLGRQ
ncbi:MAG: hypothetical protein JO306_08795 [Gemmatimonadetes bacterium]|nr:hypothetical protein [Gemmatimonadota bacterium]